MLIKRMIIMVALLVGPGLVPASAQSDNVAQFLQRFRDWSAYKYDAPDKKICFAVSQPKDFEPKNSARGQVYFYISNWPSDGVVEEISVKFGSNFLKGSTSTATIGPDVFELFTDGDKAFVASPAQERKLVGAMRRGAKLVLKGKGSGGGDVTDVYSLAGITAALNHASVNCR